MAVKVTELLVQILVDEAAITTEGVTAAVTVIVIALEVPVAGTAQARLEVKTTLTISPFDKVVVVSAGALVPVLTPFSCHWYAGVVPPLVGVAVKITLVPGQIIVDDAATTTEGVTDAVTIIVIVLDVAVAGDAQAALEFMITVTTSPLANAELL